MQYRTFLAPIAAVSLTAFGLLFGPLPEARAEIDDLVIRVTGTNKRVSLTDIVRHNEAWDWVYGLSLNIYEVDEQGLIIPESVIAIPQLIDCRNGTAASFNVETKKFQVLPLDRSSFEARVCKLDFYSR